MLTAIVPAVAKDEEPTTPGLLEYFHEEYQSIFTRLIKKHYRRRARCIGGDDEVAFQILFLQMVPSVKLIFRKLG